MKTLKQIDDRYEQVYEDYNGELCLRVYNLNGFGSYEYEIAGGIKYANVLAQSDDGYGLMSRAVAAGIQVMDEIVDGYDLPEDWNYERKREHENHFHDLHAWHKWLEENGKV